MFFGAFRDLFNHRCTQGGRIVPPAPSEDFLKLDKKVAIKYRKRVPSPRFSHNPTQKKFENDCAFLFTICFVSISKLWMLICNIPT
jgi:hypothetical protein